MSFFDSLFQKKERSVLGVDIGSSSLKVVQLRREKGKAILETYGELALGPYGGAAVGQATNLPAEQIALTLKDLLREAKVTTTTAGVSIPFARSLLTLVRLPKRDNEEEQKTIIELEARKFIPIPLSEVQLDWFVVPESEAKGATTGGKEEKKSIDVLLVAVHNDELTLLQQAVTGAGLTASFYEIEIFSTIRAAALDPVKPAMVLDIGAATTKVYIVEHGVVQISHSITTGSQDITRAIAAAGNLPIARAEALKKQAGFDGLGGQRSSLELVFERIFSEARRVILQYEAAHERTITEIVLAGGGGVTKELGTHAQQTFSIPVRVADPFAKTEAPAFMRPVLQEIGPEFAVAVGLALRKLDEI